MKPAEVAVGQELLLALSQGHQHNLTVGEQGLAPLQRLLRYHVIEKTNSGYSFEVPLLEEWVRLRSAHSSLADRVITETKVHWEWVMGNSLHHPISSISPSVSRFTIIKCSVDESKILQSPRLSYWKDIV